MSWIGVDLDSTLAKYISGSYAKDPYYVGEPIPIMLERVKAWRAEGIEVRIMTARVYSKDPSGPDPKIITAIQDWCEKHVGEVLPITNEKDDEMFQLWDDRAIQVIPNTGVPVVPNLIEAFRYGTDGTDGTNG